MCRNSWSVVGCSLFVVNGLWSVVRGQAFVIALAVMLLGGLPATAQTDGPEKPKPDSAPANPGPAKAKADPAASKVDEMLANALKNNPDIRVALAKLREAEAELNRTRLQVTQKVLGFQSARDSQREVIAVAEAQLKEIMELKGKGVINEKSVREAQAKLTSAKAKLAEVEAALPYLLGKQTSSDVDNFMRWEMIQSMADLDHWNANRSLITGIDHTKRVRLWDLDTGKQLTDTAQPIAVPMTEKLRKALDTALEVRDRPIPLKVWLEYFEEKVPGVSFRLLSGTGTGKKEAASMEIQFNFKEKIPLGAAIQAIEDTLPGLRFVVRDYGILVTWEDQLPPGALHVNSFWKRAAAQEKGEKKSSAKPNLPPQGILEGVVLETDAKNRLVTISMGSDDGLQKGHTLEVYRMEPRPQFLGTIQIVDVRAKDAVGRVTGATSGKQIQKGDKVNFPAPSR